MSIRPFLAILAKGKKAFDPLFETPWTRPQPSLRHEQKRIDYLRLNSMFLMMRIPICPRYLLVAAEQHLRKSLFVKKGLCLSP